MEELLNEEITQEETEPIIETEPIFIEEKIEDQEPEEETNEDLLIEYIKQELAKNEENEESNLEGDTYSSEDALSDGYEDILSDIQSDLSAMKNELIYQTSIYDDYNDNNNLQADLDEISLSNLLLFFLFNAVLFTAALNFSRRIF